MYIHSLVPRKQIGGNLFPDLPVVKFVGAALACEMLCHMAIRTNPFQVAIVAIRSILILVMASQYSGHSVVATSFTFGFPCFPKSPSMGCWRFCAATFIGYTAGMSGAIVAASAPLATRGARLSELLFTEGTLRCDRGSLNADQIRLAEALCTGNASAIKTTELHNPCKMRDTTKLFAAADTCFGDKSDVSLMSRKEPARSSEPVIPSTFSNQRLSATTCTRGIRLLFLHCSSATFLRAKPILRWASMFMFEFSTAILAFVTGVDGARLIGTLDRAKYSVSLRRAIACYENVAALTAYTSSVVFSIHQYITSEQAYSVVQPYEVHI